VGLRAIRAGPCLLSIIGRLGSDDTLYMQQFLDDHMKILTIPLPPPVTTLP
jgi:hypothetical protein